MKCVFTVLFYFAFSHSVFCQNQWYQIPNHDEEIYINLDEKVLSFNETKQACSNINSSVLVLWNKNVIHFLGNFLHVLFTYPEGGK